MLQKIHLWIGVAIGVFFSFSGISGSILVFDDELDTYFNSNLWQVASQSGPIQLDEATHKITTEFSKHNLSFIRLPRESNHSIEYWLSKNDVITNIYVDPWKLNILGIREEHSGLLGFLHDFHVHLLSSDEGLLINGLLGLILLFTVLTGLWLAWPGWCKLGQALRIPHKTSRVARWFALHRSIGLISMVFLASAAITGAAMVFYKPTNAALIKLFGGPTLSDPPVIESIEPNMLPLPPSKLLQAAESYLPGAKATWLSFPGRPEIPFIVRLKFPDDAHPNGTSYVALHPETGEALMIHNSEYSGLGQQIADMKYPLHIGTIAGISGRIVIFISGLVPVILFITGVYTWWCRRKKTQLKLDKNQTNFNRANSCD